MPLPYLLDHLLKCDLKRLDALALCTTITTYLVTPRQRVRTQRPRPSIEFWTRSSVPVKPCW
jgi:hypothetical protein